MTEIDGAMQGDPLPLMRLQSAIEWGENIVRQNKKAGGNELEHWQLGALLEAAKRYAALQPIPAGEESEK